MSSGFPSREEARTTGMTSNLLSKEEAGRTGMTSNLTSQVSCFCEILCLRERASSDFTKARDHGVMHASGYQGAENQFQHPERHA